MIAFVGPYGWLVPVGSVLRGQVSRMSWGRVGRVIVSKAVGGGSYMRGWLSEQDSKQAVQTSGSGALQHEQHTNNQNDIRGGRNRWHSYSIKRRAFDCKIAIHRFKAEKSSGLQM